jgi:hypothetical protein
MRIYKYYTYRFSGEQRIHIEFHNCFDELSFIFYKSMEPFDMMDILNIINTLNGMEWIKRKITIHIFM